MGMEAEIMSREMIDKTFEVAKHLGELMKELPPGCSPVWRGYKMKVPHKKKQRGEKKFVGTILLSDGNNIIINITIKCSGGVVIRSSCAYIAFAHQFASRLHDAGHRVVLER